VPSVGILVVITRFVSTAAPRRCAVFVTGPAMNRWNIPAWLEEEVMARDTACVYCGVDFTSPTTLRGARASWEHIANDATIITRENIARCCMSCNASKGTKTLESWLRSKYCQRKGINQHTVAATVRMALSGGKPMQVSKTNASQSVAATEG
jgi:hypothetical protein